MAFHAEKSRRVQVEQELDENKHGNASLQAHAHQQAEVSGQHRSWRANGDHGQPPSLSSLSSRPVRILTMW